MKNGELFLQNNRDLFIRIFNARFFAFICMIFFTLFFGNLRNEFLLIAFDFFLRNSFTENKKS